MLRFAGATEFAHPTGKRKPLQNETPPSPASSAAPPKPRPVAPPRPSGRPDFDANTGSRPSNQLARQSRRRHDRRHCWRFEERTNEQLPQPLLRPPNRRQTARKCDGLRRHVAEPIVELQIASTPHSVRVCAPMWRMWRMWRTPPHRRQPPILRSLRRAIRPEDDDCRRRPDARGDRLQAKLAPRGRKSIKTARAKATKRPPLGRIGPAPKVPRGVAAGRRNGLGSRLPEAFSRTENPGRFGSTSGVAAPRTAQVSGAQFVRLPAEPDSPMSSSASPHSSQLAWARRRLPVPVSRRAASLRSLRRPVKLKSPRAVPATRPSARPHARGTPPPTSRRSGTEP